MEIGHDVMVAGVVVSVAEVASGEDATILVAVRTNEILAALTIRCSVHIRWYSRMVVVMNQSCKRKAKISCKRAKS